MATKGWPLNPITMESARRSFDRFVAAMSSPPPPPPSGSQVITIDPEAAREAVEAYRREIDAERERRITACERHVWILDPALGQADCDVFCKWCSARTTAPNMTVAAEYAERKFPSRAGRRERATRRRALKPARVTR